MKFLFLIVFASLQIGCATTLVTKEGFHTSADMYNVTWTPTSFHADKIDSSKPTSTLYTGIAKGVTAAGAAGVFLLTK